MILRHEQPFLLKNEAPPPVPVGQLTPRDYQVAGIEVARERIAAGVRALLLVMATGGGKTVVAALVAKGAATKGKRCLFIGPRREIIAQAFWKLVEAGVAESDLGVIMADGIIPHGMTREPYNAKRPNAPVQVASVQTLANRRLPPADVVFVDEAHHATSSTWARIIEHYRTAGAVVVGLTATPCRADGRGLGALFEQLHVIATFRQLAEHPDGPFLVAPRTFTTPRRPDLSKVRITDTGDYHQEELAKAMDRGDLVGDVVEHYQRLGAGRRGVVFAASVKHSRHLTEAFVAAGIRAEHLDGETDKVERDAILLRLKRGETHVVCNYGVLTEGWDEPAISYVAIARPTKSLSLFLQMAGRGLRPAPGKPDALLVDHAGCVHEHGLPQDDRDWSLDGEVKRKSATPVRTCEQCYAALPTGTQQCTECGYVFPVEEREKPEQVDGQLVEAEAKPPPTMEERLAWYEGALQISASRGRRLGFARHRYKERFGVWPRGPRVTALERVHYPPPSAEESSPPSVEPVAAAPIASSHEVIPALTELGIESAPATPVRKARRIDVTLLLPPAVPPTQTTPVEEWTL